MNQLEAFRRAIRGALEPFDDIAFVFLFGSAVSARLRSDSDLDVAVYGVSGRHLEIETDRELTGEAKMQLAVERETGRNVDLLVLNRAPAVVCASAVSTGVPVFIRDESVCSRYILAITDVAIDFLETEREWRAIRSRSASLSPQDRSRLERILAFLEDELKDAPEFADTNLAAYQRERSLRRNLDRWVEVLINGTIDIAKIVEASEDLPIPQTYAQILNLLPSVPEFSAIPEEIRNLAPLRNVMAHEYLDLRFTRLRRFIDSDIRIIRTVIAVTRAWIDPPDQHDEPHADE
ncbi:MAG: DUF86 domain-containing protein [Spirochaeta sp.]|jgi:uncharacterized protein YutE (UPF0331/DUF86 family)/predicted nucleotidyltransferase|nr:DUF86 domain-containing protein [Spirochaeta sp.]